MKKISRRVFLKLTGATGAAGGLFFLLGRRATDVAAQTPAKPLRIHYAREVTTICPYCSVGCGAICQVIEGEVVSIAGDPDHPINEGTLCSKGGSMLNLRNIYDPQSGKLVLNPNRLTKVLYRAPFGTEWEEKSWAWALTEIAKRVKATRDATFETKDTNGVTVNRTTAIAHLGSAAIDNEENYLMHKLMRALGVINLDHHARL